MTAVIDAWVNVALPKSPAPWQRQAAEQFGRPFEEVFRDFDIAEILELMDAHRIERAVLTLRADRPSKRVLQFAEAHPDRFLFSALVDPRQGMKAIRNLEALRQNQPLALARVIPSMLGLAPNDRVYYPLYAKCVEMALPISVNTGIPGPALPSRCQDPLHLDDVCLFFPELVLIMANGADPWWDVAIRLMLKFPNLSMMTSAYAPKYLPQSLLHFMTTRGQDKIMFASDFPFLTPQRCLSEARELGLPDEVLGKFLYSNAARVLLRDQATQNLP